MQHITYIKDLEAENDAAGAVEGDVHGGGGRAAAAVAAASGAGAGGGRAGTASGARGGGQTEGPSSEDQKRDDAEALKKDDDDFAKLEALFINELKLTSVELPKYAKHLGVDVAVEEDKAKRTNNRS